MIPDITHVWCEGLDCASLDDFDASKPDTYKGLFHMYNLDNNEFSKKKYYILNHAHQHLLVWSVALLHEPSSASIITTTYSKWGLTLFSSDSV